MRKPYDQEDSERHFWTDPPARIELYILTISLFLCINIVAWGSPHL